MSAVAAAVGVGAIGGALIEGNAAQGAAGTEANAANSATQAQIGMFNTEQANAAPWLQSGKDNLATLNADMPQLTSQFTMQDFNQSPGYQFQLNQGLQAMQRSAAASGMLNSTGTQQGLNNYAQGAANTDYQQALTNFTNSQQQRYNMLSGMSQQGLNAAQMTNTAAANAGNNISSNIIGAGNAAAAGQVGTANAAASGISGAANGYMNYNLMSNLFKGGGNPSLTSGLDGSSQLGQGLTGPLSGADTGGTGFLGNFSLTD